MDFTPVKKELFYSKADPTDPRLGEWPQVLTEHLPRFHILGYPDDEGIRLNAGRPGAALGPDAIRQAFYKMTPDASTKRKFSVIDLGNLNLEGTLAERHERGRKAVSEILKKKDYWISLGGGHDYGYCDATAFTEFYKEQKPLVVNFDAHLDVRPADKSYHSGTPFYRLMTEFKDIVNFIEVGLQPQCNSPYHLEWLQEQGGKVLWIDDILERGMPEALQQIVPLSIHPAFVSVDIDGLSSAIAPGCSQSWPSGMDWHHFVQALDFLVEAFDVRGLGIYEVSPPLDQDHQTSKLAALIMHRFMFQTLKKDK